MKTRGRKDTPGEKHLKAQVAKVFSARLEKKGGAKQAARDLNISLASFYNYSDGQDLPRMEVLRDAQRKWEGVKWELIDVSDITEKKKTVSAEQYVLSFLQDVHEKDVEIAKIGPKGERTLQVLLNIRFPG